MEYRENFYRYLMKVPNNEDGQNVIKSLRQYYNKDRYKIRVKGSTIDKSKCPNVKEQKYRNDIGAIPLNVAKYLRVYIDEKYPSRWG